MKFLSRFENWILRKILIKIIINHKIFSLFGLVYDIHREVYFEDNHYGSSHDLQENLRKVCHHKAEEIKNNFID